MMEEKNVLVTIIVPVYNVREYLDACIESIIGQTYKNIEIIIVDDGSTDGSSDICDQFATKDKRIKVLHKHNGGLSSARNAGIDVCKGRYIAFADSDDWIMPDMIECLISNIIEFNADIACCDYFSDDHNIPQGRGVSKYDNSTAISMLFDEVGYKCYAWNKIYKTELFNNIRYPEGELFEDIKTTYRLFKEASSVLYVKEAKYYYRLRDNSITRKKFSEKDLDLVNAINYVRDDSLWLEKSKRERLLAGYINYYLFYLKKGLCDEGQIDNEIRVFQEFVLQNLLMIIKSDFVHFKFKIELFLLIVSKNLFGKLLKIKLRG